MKRLILTLLVLSPAAFAAPMNCSALGDFINRRFSDLQRADNNPGCSQETFPEITQERNDPAITRVIGQYGCKNLNVIENNLNQLESEIALLSGFEKMKNDIVRNQEVAGSQSLTRARRAAADFHKGLVTARALEAILDTTGTTRLIRDIKALPIQQRNSKRALRESVTRLCQGRPAPEAQENSSGLIRQNACDSNFEFDEVAVAELNTLLESASLEDSQINDWTNALGVEVDGSPYNFRTMYSKVEGAMRKIGEGSLGLTREQLNDIKRLPAFQNRDALPLLNNLTNRVSQMSLHINVDQTKVLASELKSRQVAETTSKISWVLKETRSNLNLSTEEQEICNQLTQGITKAQDCWNIIKRKQSTMTDSQAVARDLIGNLIPSMDSAFPYIVRLNNVPACLDNGQAESALTRSNFGYTFNGPECADFATDTLHTKIEDAKVLKALRKKILDKNERDSKVTEFALKKFQTLNCINPSDIISTAVGCDDPSATIAREAITLNSTLLGMSLTVQDPNPNPDIASICEEPKRDEQQICEFLAPPPATPNVTDRPAPPTQDSPYIEPQNARDPAREAFNDGLAGIGWGIVNQLQNRPQMYNPYQSFNPYPYNYNPYLAGGMMSPSDQILYNARFFGGYGMYTPTLGAAPYTAFPLISPYVQAGYSSSGNSSSYFSNFGTYK